MPPTIGSFISHFVYGGKLHSSRSHPIQDSLSCKFINAIGKECKSDNSFEVCASSLCSPLLTIMKNHAECIAVIKAAFELQKHHKSYHILTPYTGQCDLIEKEMKKNPGLIWEDKCFTVDSFQGLHFCSWILFKLKFVLKEMKMTTLSFQLFDPLKWGF